MKKRICEICGKAKNNVVKKHKTNKLICGRCDRKAGQIIAKCVKCGKTKIIQWADKCHACYKAERRKILQPNKIVKKSILNKDELADYLSKNQNAQMKDIAMIFSRSVDTIRKCIKRNKIPYTPPLHSKKIDDIALLDYTRENPNVFIADIAKHFNVHPQTISRYLRKYNVRADRKKCRNAKLAQYIRENPDKSLREIAGRFGLSKETIRRRVITADIPHQKKIFNRYRGMRLRNHR